MTFQKGRTKTGGRTKGVRNKTDSATKAALRLFVDKEIKTLPRMIDDLTVKERFDVLKGLLPYVYPKKQEMNVRSELNALLDNLETLTEAQLERLKEILTEIYQNT